MMKRVYGRIVGDHLILPAAALEILPKEGVVYMITDSERGSVTAFAEDLSKIDNPQLYEALAALNEGLTEDEYLKPVSPEQLRRRKKNDGEGGMGKLRAVLDANVLYDSFLRDLLMSLFSAGMYSGACACD